MYGYFRRCLVLVITLSLLLSTHQPVKAARGQPGSPEFGFGAELYPDGPFVDEAMKMAVEMELDWLRIPVAWSAYQPDAASPPDFGQLETVMETARANHIAVLVSVSAAPAWALTARGPDAVHAAQFVSTLCRRFPDAVQAVELFPRANTQAGWGRPASPQEYSAVFHQVDSSLREAGLSPILVAAGLQPLVVSEDGDMDDLEFLQALYDQGAAEWMPVVSLQYGEVTGSPLDFPGLSSRPVLRHYEEVRKVMLDNHHPGGLIWITHICPPSGTIEVSGSQAQDANSLTGWLGQLYIQTRSQLYLGVTIGQSLNFRREGSAAGVPSMLLESGQVHPFYTALREMISLNRAGSATIKPGRPKEGSFSKKRP